VAITLPLACADDSTKVIEQAALRCSDAPVVRTGFATFYATADGSGNCGFDPTPNDLMIGGMNHTDYAGSFVCGTCVSVLGPKGNITIRIVDQCPGCGQGDIDLSPLAFSLIADTSLGRVPIQWHTISCDVNGPIIYHFKAGSNQWWTAVQIRNHRYAVSSVEYLTPQGMFKPISRLDYNYFVEPGGMGPGPYVFRVTDIYNHSLIDSGIVLAANANISGNKQFPSCAP
jgi:expansin